MKGAGETVCYCFNYTDRDIEKDVEANGFSMIIKKITAEKKAGACQCPTKNPKDR
jgi:hypothetical protein